MSGTSTTEMREIIKAGAAAQDDARRWLRMNALALTPRLLRTATAEYFAAEDLIGRWLSRKNLSLCWVQSGGTA